MNKMTRYWQSKLEQIAPKKRAERAIWILFVDRIEVEELPEDITIPKLLLFKASDSFYAPLSFSHLRDRRSLWLPEWQNIPADSLLKVGTMFKGRSKSLFVGTLIALAYTIYIIGYMASTGHAVSSEDSAEAVGTGLAML